MEVQQDVKMEVEEARTSSQEVTSGVKTSSSDDQGSGAASPLEDGGKPPPQYEDSFDYPEDEVSQNKIITAALQKEDEFLEYLMSLPAGGRERDKERSCKPSQQPPLMRSTSERGGTKVGLDHLDNLCKLMEQLGDLRERNSKLQRRVQYLEDLKNLHEMHKQLQQETMKRHLQEATLLQMCRQAESPHHHHHHHHRSKKACRHRQSLQPSNQQRERSQSVGLDELTDYKPSKRRQRRSVAGFAGGGKAKVSKWTKVKEAFRWEKASDAGGRYLRVPVGEGPTSGGSPSPESLGSPVIPSVSTLSTSSSSEELDLELNYSDILSEFVVGPQRSASATDSTGGRVLIPEPRRLSLTGATEEEDASRRSKSLDGDATVVGPLLVTRQHFSSKEMKIPSQIKHHKTPWGKVKDIIQTRKDSLKKRQSRATHHKGEGSDHEEEGEGEQPPTTPPDDVIESKLSPRPRIEVTGETPQRRHKSSTSSLGAYPEASGRRLTPMLTITLPSTEELRQIKPGPASSSSASPKISAGSPPRLNHSRPSPSPQPEERQPKSPTSPLHSDDGRGEFFSRQQSGTSYPSGGLGTSPPVLRRPSKWTKVKKAFLTSPGRRDDDVTGRQTTSGPSSPNRISTFFYETDPDELSSGETGEPPGEDEDLPRESTSEPTSLQAEIQRNYEELQVKLSQEFHKKLSEWERIKASAAATSGVGRASSGPGVAGEEKSFRRKIEEWERMKRKRESVALHPPDEDQLSPHFRKKLQEWQRIKRERKSKGGESPTSKEAGEAAAADFTTPSPGVVRKESKKTTPVIGGGGGGAKGAHKGKTQKEKELHWLEKELHKIEREKQRLEREREKYLDREQRLEKMRRAMGSGVGKQEVLIQTSTGFFRFQGISEKFTRRLYEWEKARGIAPEASTFALLDPGYRPSREERPGGGDGADNMMLMRSKSAGSVTNLTGPGQSGTGITHQPSSLSLNDVEALEQAAQELADARATSDPQLHGEEDDELAAVIVDVEDVVEETAAPLEAVPVVEGQTPVYCYAPKEITRLIDSSGSESDRDSGATVRRTDSTRTNDSDERRVSNSVHRTESVRTECSYKLLEENMSLLTKLKIKGDICRQLENELEDLEEKIDHVTRTHDEELERLRQEETDLRELSPERTMTEEGSNQPGTSGDCCDQGSGDQGAMVDQLRAKISELERRQQRLRREGVTLQDSFAHHSKQQAALAQNLVGKMKQLQQANSTMTSFEAEEPTTNRSESSRQQTAMAAVQELSTQLLSLAEKLEEALGERNKEIRSLRSELEERRGGEEEKGSAEHNRKASEGGRAFPRQSSEELTQLPSLLTHKVLELKQGLNYLCATTDQPPSPDTTATFVLKRPRPGDGETSPVTSVTITPAFLRRRATEPCTSATPREGQEEAVKKSLLPVRVPEVTQRFRSEDVRQKRPVKLRRSSENHEVYKRVDNSQGKQAVAQGRSVTVENKQTTEGENAESKTSSSIVRTASQVLRRGVAPSATPVNVFVQTTRKIFAPVRRDSKGKASSVIGYVVEENNNSRAPTADAGTARPNAPAPTPQWMSMRSRSQSASPALPRRRVLEGGAPAKISPESTGSEESSSTSKETVQEAPPLPTATPMGFPPLPPSPSPSRREANKHGSKDTAPSIRMMIARYNQKLTSQQEGGTEGGSGSASPVAWRSPVAERRVRTQMAKYQEEVERALRQPCRRVEVQKSASAGVIPAGDARNGSAATLADRTPTVHRRGILKSSSAGAIKPSVPTTFTPPTRVETPVVAPSEVETGALKRPVGTVTPLPSPSPPREPASPPMNQLRALRLQRAKEEFLTRGPGGQSWTSEGSSAENRLSQVSVGSESSYEGSLVLPEPQQTPEEDGPLVKSASAGMINVDPHTFNKLAGKKDKPKDSSKFGISSLTSKFRKVKMRKNKDKSEKMNTVSLLCRQSLVVDINRKEPTKNGEGPSSMSCPSSPVLQRGGNEDKEGGEGAQGGSVWMRNPAKLIFRPK